MVHKNLQHANFFTFLNYSKNHGIMLMTCISMIQNLVTMSWSAKP